jgi:hypothetical protein
MNPNYATIVKQDLDKLLSARFITSVEEASWISPIVIVSKKNGKFYICLDFQWLNVNIKKDPYPLPSTKEVLDKMARHEVYLFLDGFSNYHQIMIAPKNWYKIAFITNWGAFVWVIMPFRFSMAWQNTTSVSLRTLISLWPPLSSYCTRH